MLRMVRIVAILLLASIHLSQKVASEELQYATTTQHGEPAKHEIDVLINNDDALSAAKAMPKLSASRETLDFRRSADFYSWHGSCYTQDRHQNWYEIDGRLC
jgi:hypothetical protein